MPVTTQIVTTEFLNEFKNDVGFVSNLGDFTNNFTGSVMENVKFIQTLDISWKVTYSSPNGSAAQFAWTFSLTGTVLTITRSQGNFRTDGFAVGDTVDLFIFTTFITLYAGIPVLSINGVGNIMLVDLGTGVFPAAQTSITIHGVSPLVGLKYSFGLIENQEAFNVQSKVSGNQQGYYSGDIGLGSPRSTAFVPMIRLGVPQGWQTGSMRVRYVSDPAPRIQRFEIEHIFTIVPYYLDGELNNLQNNIIPTLLNGLASLKYVYDADFRVVLTNQNTSKLSRYDYDLGDIAWFGETFNGLQPDYAVTSVTYEEQITAASASGILIGGKTRIRVTLDKLSGAFVGAERFGAYISYLPAQAEYTNTTLSNLKQNFLYDNALNNAGLGPVAGQDFITAISATIVSGDLEIIIDMEYSSAQKAFLSAKFNQGPVRFLLAIQGGDITKANANSDRLLVLADVELYDQSPDISDLMHVKKFDIYGHDEQIGVDTPSTNKTLWNEDGIVIDYTFDVNLNLEAVLNSLSFAIVAYNPTTDQFWIINEFPFSPLSAIISSGVQQINVTTTRGYILLSGDQFDDMTIAVGSQAAGLQDYDGRYSQKVPWQQWLQDLNVDTSFYNVAEPHNNFNKKASNYSALFGYEIRFAVFANLSGKSPLGVTGVTDYLFLSPEITVFDYEKDGILPPIWSCVIQTLDPVTMTDLGGAIQTGADTLFKVTWTNSLGPVAAIGNLWGINRIEETLQPGYAIAELSSLNLPLPAGQQLLKAKPTFTLLDVTLVAGTIVFECLIDGSLIQQGKNYNLSSRIHDPDFIDPGAKLTSPDDVIKDTSGAGSTTKIQAP